ncbi:Dps family protein [Aquimarina agarilytica]|uniref:Dps family protein n=1 Tax=Aquimarina agarilytica TaxID=1087449 RepID=UPI0002884513|nr:DNA starvation/stationary phase protection protein [Aquimarina agarilytica]
METNIGISEKNRKAVVEKLEIILADEFVLNLKTRNAHWNVVGIDFADKHALFEAQYNQLAAIIDEVAERIRILGFKAPASISEFSKLTTLTEFEGGERDSTSFIKELTNDHEKIIKFLRSLIIPFADDYKDLGTSDYITGLIQIHEKIAWFLKAHLS